jgi:hypothetical protein
LLSKKFKVMLDLRTHIEEALFDKKGIDPEKAAEKFY